MQQPGAEERRRARRRRRLVVGVGVGIVRAAVRTAVDRPAVLRAVVGVARLLRGGHGDVDVDVGGGGRRSARRRRPDAVVVAVVVVMERGDRVADARELVGRDRTCGRDRSSAVAPCEEMRRLNDLSISLAATVASHVATDDDPTHRNGRAAAVATHDDDGDHKR